MMIHPEVRAALDAGQPVVALESNLFTHGLPFDINLVVARALEAAVREGGATPATIAVLGGQITVGLTDDQLVYLASATSVRKCSQRDLPIAVGRGEDGGTTVATTMFIAHRAGIRVFATGGIGGVHRGNPFDISADLTELGRTPTVVVCSGAKSILDLPLTLEVLETMGVPIIGYGTDELPAFYTNESGLPVDVRCDTAEDVAAIVRAHDALNLPGGLLVTVPVPLAHELRPAEAESAIGKALALAETQGIRGKALTPFLLDSVRELTGKASQQANVDLLLNNARVASAIAVTMAKSDRKQAAFSDLRVRVTERGFDGNVQEI
jgi:pseudouridine-5'-phosphate glycosidase